MAFVAIFLVLADLPQRTVVAAAARIFPSARHKILGRWIQLMRTMVLDVAMGWLGGAKFQSCLRLPSRPSVLVLMNHQSLLDIPLVVGAFPESYPRIVTRRRYTRWIPLISHMIRLYQYPTVDPGATVRGDLDRLREVVSSGELPLVMFPEGSRSRDGTLGRFKRAGLRAILRARKWEVHLVVVDGLWQTRRFLDLKGVSEIRAALRCTGPFESPGPDADPDVFIEEMHDRMSRMLSELRGVSA